MADLTPAQEAQRQKRLSEIPEEKQSVEDGLESVEENQEELNKTQDLDSAFFNTLNDDIVRRYEKERRWINGNDDANSVSLSEIKNVSEGSGRLFDNTIFDVVRVANFDGGDLDTGLTPRENLVPARDDRAFDWIRNGFNDGPDPTGSTTTNINDSSTTFEIDDDTNIVAGRKYLVTNNNSAVIEVSNIESTVSGSIPPFEVTFDFHQIDDVIFNTNGGGISSGSSLKGSRAFSNSERSSQTASPSGDQNTLDNSFQLLFDSLSERKSLIFNQLNEIGQNEDKNIDQDYVSGVFDIVNDIDNFENNSDFSNSGLNFIETILNNRDTDSTSRVNSILDQLDGTEQGYYETRYLQAQTIGNRIYGSYSKFFYSQNAEDILNQIGTNLDNVSGVYTTI